MENNEGSKSTSKFGLITTLSIGAAAVGFSIAAIPFLTPALRKHALPYVPATPKQLDNVFNAIKSFHFKPQPSKANRIKLIDLGSGDGRIVFEAAKRGYDATGVELNALLFLYSKYKSLVDSTVRSSCLYRPKFYRANFWNINMSDYDLIVVFGVQEMMKDLATKLKLEMKHNALIVSCRYPISDFKSVYNLEDELDSVWIYDKNSFSTKVNVNIDNKKAQNKSHEDDDDD